MIIVKIMVLIVCSDNNYYFCMLEYSIMLARSAAMDINYLTFEEFDCYRSEDRFVHRCPSLWTDDWTLDDSHVDLTKYTFS